MKPLQEAVVHGTVAWMAKTRRRSILFKYSRHDSAFHDPAALAPLRKLATTAEQRLLLEWRGSGARGRGPAL